MSRSFWTSDKKCWQMRINWAEVFYFHLRYETLPARLLWFTLSYSQGLWKIFSTALKWVQGHLKPAWLLSKVVWHLWGLKLFKFPWWFLWSWSSNLWKKYIMVSSEISLWWIILFGVLIKLAFSLNMWRTLCTSWAIFHALYRQLLSQAVKNEREREREKKKRPELRKLQLGERFTGLRFCAQTINMRDSWWKKIINLRRVSNCSSAKVTHARLSKNNNNNNHFT